MKKYLIIGTSAAAIGVLNKLRTLDPQATITCISDESEFPYNKCFLNDYLAGTKTIDALSTKPLQFFEHNRIQLMLGKRVVDVKAHEKKIVLDDGQSLSYDSLFFGTGSSPIIPDIVKLNPHMRGLFTFHTLSDSTALLQYITDHSIRHAVIVGAGLTGLEVTDALLSRGLSVTLLSRQGSVLRRCIDKGASDLIERMMQERGVRLVKYAEPKELLVSEQKMIRGIQLKDGCEIEAGVVVLATGLRPNSDLAYKAGLTLNHGYVAVNEYMQTSDSAIWAGGDCCMVRDQMSGELVPSSTWPDAMMQGAIAAYGMSGQNKKYPGIAAVMSSSFFGTHLVTAGNILAPEPHWQTQVQQGNDFYHAMTFEGQRLRGFLLLGQTSQAPLLKRALLTGQQW